MRKISLALLLLIFSAAASVPTGPSLSELFQKGYYALDNWQFEDADEIAVQVQTLLQTESKARLKEQACYFLAQYWFDKGEYQKSFAQLDAALAVNPKSGEDIKLFHQRVKRLSEIFSGAQETQSRHFRLRWSDPRDQVLVKPGLLVLEQAFQALSRDFNFTPAGGKILVEIYPRLEDLAAGVGLEEKMLRDSGTVAICKFRRLMLVSPRCLLFGYDYQTTLSHELVHFFVYSRNGDTVPIWLHEGLARFEDQSYKNAAGQLDPVSKSLLISALQSNQLLTFSQMHPSFAQFKTPKQGQLAFAEVTTMVGFIRRQCGNDAWFKLLDLLKQGKNDKAALEQVCGQSFDALWAGWKQEIIAQNWKLIPGAEVLKLEFKEQSMKEGAEDETEPILEKDQTSEYIRLGDLLRDRGFFQAAAYEYQKAVALEPYNSRALNKLGLCQVLAGNFKAALEPLTRLTETYPQYSTGFVNLGLAYSGLQDDARAMAAFERALELNPFNPMPYRKLVELYAQTGNQAKVREMQEAYNIIHQNQGG